MSEDVQLMPDPLAARCLYCGRSVAEFERPFQPFTFGTTEDTARLAGIAFVCDQHKGRDDVTATILNFACLLKRELEAI